MTKPYFETIRIARDSDTKQEFEYSTMILWADVNRIEEPAGDDFKNEAPKAVIFMKTECSIWVLTPYEKVRDLWKEFLDGYLIYSPLRS
jgi:hypothetical protein